MTKKIIEIKTEDDTLMYVSNHMLNFGDIILDKDPANAIRFDEDSTYDLVVGWCAKYYGESNITVI